MACRFAGVDHFGNARLDFIFKGFFAVVHAFKLVLLAMDGYFDVVGELGVEGFLVDDF